MWLVTFGLFCKMLPITELRMSSVASKSLLTTRWATASICTLTILPMMIRLAAGAGCRPVLIAHQSSRTSKIFWFTFHCTTWYGPECGISIPPTNEFTSSWAPSTCAGTIGMPVSNLSVSTSNLKRGAGVLKSPRRFDHRRSYILGRTARTGRGRAACRSSSGHRRCRRRPSR